MGLQSAFAASSCTGRSGKAQCPAAELGSPETRTGNGVCSEVGVGSSSAFALRVLCDFG